MDAQKNFTQSKLNMPQTPIQYEGREEAMAVVPNYHAWILGAFEPYLGNTVAEVGAGTGNFSSLLIQKVSGRMIVVEPAAQMYPLLQERFAGNPRVTCEPYLFGDVVSRYKEALDAIVYVNVLEHVEHDLQEITMARDALKPGGHLCIFVPAMQSLYSTLDANVGHYRRYSKKQLTALVRDAGYEVVEVRYVDIVGILPWLLFIKLLRWPMTAGGTGLYDRLVVPIMSKVEYYVHPPIGKNLLIVGRKPL